MFFINNTFTWTSKSVTNFIFPVSPNPLVAPAIVSHWIAFDGQICQVAGWNTANSKQFSTFFTVVSFLMIIILF